MRALVTGLTTVHAHCMSCGWDELYEDEPQMQQLIGRAKYHARQNKHRVHIWRERLFVYDGNSDD